MRKLAQTGQLDLVKCDHRIKRFSNYFNLNIGGQNCFQPYKIVQFFIASLEAWPPPYDVDLEAAVRWPVRQVALSNNEVGLTCALAGLFLSSVRAYVQPSQSNLQISSFSSCLCWRWAGQRTSEVVVGLEVNDGLMNSDSQRGFLSSVLLLWHSQSCGLVHRKLSFIY